MPKGKKKHKKYSKKRRVTKMPALAEKPIDKDREEKLALARTLHDEITEKMSAAGVTQEELETETYRAFLDVKESRRSRRN